MLAASDAIKPVKRMIYLTNHDQNYNDGGHLISDIYGENVYPLTALLFTFNGMPLLYNGQEIGGKQILDYFNDTKINWDNRDDKMYAIIKNIAAIKHATTALRDDAQIIIHKTSNPQTFAYTRASGKDAVLTVINLGTSAIDVEIDGALPGTYTQKYNGGNAPEKISETIAAPAKITVPQKGFVIYTK